jgi:hypothetical protein
MRTMSTPGTNSCTFICKRSWIPSIDAIFVTRLLLVVVVIDLELLIVVLKNGGVVEGVVFFIYTKWKEHSRAVPSRVHGSLFSFLRCFLNIGFLMNVL